jgi:fructan beta-fructosidase
MKLHPIIFFLLFLSFGCSQKKPSATFEKYQPVVHFSPGKVWNSDVMGLVSEGGRFHLFYQIIPENSKSGKLEWKRASSQNLIDWEMGESLKLPDGIGEVLFSSVVVDAKNTSGLGKDGKTPWVALASEPANDELQKNLVDFSSLALVFSIDSGHTWIKSQTNPNSNHSGLGKCRFPKISWNNDIKKWNLVGSKGDHLSFYSSSDLLNWTFESDFETNNGAHGGVWESADLFTLKVNGLNETKWVLAVSIDNGTLNGGSGIQYFVGNFDGHQFEYTGKKNKWFDYGKDNYAGISCQDAKSGRRIFLGWMNNWQYANLIPALSWRGVLTIPRELLLTKSYGDYLMNTQPVRELQQIQNKTMAIKETEISGFFDLSTDFVIPFELSLNYNMANKTQLGFAERFGLELSNDKGEKFTVGYDNLEKFFYVDRMNAGNHLASKDFNWINYAPYMENGDSLDLRLIIDASSVELFAKNGLIVMSERVFPKEPFNHVKFFAEHGKITLIEGAIQKLIK